MALNDTLIIDIARRGTIHIPAKQADHGYDIIITVLQNGVNIVDHTTDTASFREQKPDGTAYYDSATVNNDNTVTIHVDDDGQMLAAAGFAIVDLSIETGGVVKSTQNFVLDIQAAPGGSALESSSVFANLKHMYNTLAGLWGQAPAIGESVAKTAVASFSDGADGYALKDLTAYIEPVQDLSNGDPSPTNICPITGWTGCEVTRTGKNLFNKNASDLQVGYAINPNTFVAYRTGSENYNLSGYVPIKGGQNYILSGSNRNYDIVFYDSNKTAISGRSTSWQATAPDNAVYCRFDYWAAYHDSIQLELGSTATAYEPYQGETYTIDWTDEAGTVYGGSLDVTTGVLTIDRAMINLADKDFAYYNTSGLNTFNCSLADALYSGGNAVCDKFVFDSSAHTIASQSANSMIYYKSGSGNVRLSICDNRYTSASDFKTGIGSTQLCYILDTPTTVQLTPTEVTAFLKTNIWADTGDISVDYVADTKTYIDNAIAAAINA